MSGATTGKRILKGLILLGPLILWLSLAGSCSLKQVRIDRILKDPDGLMWGKAGRSLTVHLTDRQEGEKTHFSIRVTSADQEVLHTSDMVIDRDMWGGGFVRALDIDGDSDLEILAWGVHEADKSYYLDYSDGRVFQKPLAEAPERTRTLPLEWQKAHVSAPMGTLLFFFPLTGYYLCLGLGGLGFRAYSRRKTKSRDGPKGIDHRPGDE